MGASQTNTTFRLKDAKELTYAAFGKITKDVWTKAEEHVVKIEKEYCKKNLRQDYTHAFVSKDIVTRENLEPFFEVGGRI
jgi:BMFP domain-containing protein YqiC